MSSCATTAERAAIDDVRALSIVTADAPAPDAKIDSFEDLLAAAALASPALRAAYYDAEAEARGIEAARRWPEPTVSYAYFIQSVETRVGPQQHRISASQMLPWPTKLSRAADARAAKVQVLRRRFEARRAQVLAKVRLPWAELAYLDAAKSVVADEVSILGEVEQTVRIRLEAGAASYETLVQVELRRAELTERLHSLDDRQHALRARVRALAGLSRDVLLPTPKTSTATWVVPAPGALESALDDNPELAVATARIEAAEAQIEAASAKRMPDFSLGLTWIVVGDAVNPAAADSGKDAVILGAGVKLPIALGAYGAEESAAEARREAAVARREQVAADARAKAEALVRQIRIANRRTQLWGTELIPGASSALRSALTGFSAGRATFVDVLEIERQLLRYRLGMARACADRDRAVAQLELLIGKELSR